MRFERATGAPIRTEDAPILGREFMRIATAHRINDIRALSKEIVLEEVLANTRHPLRRFYNLNVDEAAHAHWLDRTQTLLDSVRIVEANVRPHKPRAMFVAANDARETTENGETHTHKGMRLLAPDAARHDDIFVSYLESALGRVEKALGSAENWAERGTVPVRHQQLLNDLRAAFTRYMTPD